MTTDKKLEEIHKDIKKFGEKNPQWKGDKVGNGSLHEWIKNHKPKQEFCENCKKVPPYDLANISGEYKRDINDFKWLCRRCHMKEDGRINNLKKGRDLRIHKGELIHCNKCNLFKKKEEFARNKKTSDGYEFFCKLCASKLAKIKYNKRKNNQKFKERIITMENNIPIIWILLNRRNI